ncbi:MAG: SbcC/MukB-like Walker B domain-containing protein, partial [Bacteroidia bacterium]|nr:SbcC/MukB-like Walker B domain-containing protein [Bacteroidia bacterium]
ELNKSELLEELKSLEKTYHETDHQLQSYQKEQQRHKENKENLQKQLHLLTEGKDILGFMQALNTQQLRCTQGNELLKITQEYQSTKEEVEKLSRENQNKKTLLEKLAHEQKQIQEELEASQKEAEMAEKNYEQSLKIASYEEDRSKLIPGEPCPLCGATEHPYAALTLPIISEVEEQRNFWQKKVREVEEKLKHNQIEVTQLETIYRTNCKELAQKTEHLEQLDQNFKNLFHQLEDNISINFTLEVDFWQNWYQDQQNLYNDLSVKRQEIETLQNKINQIEQQISNSQKDIEMLKEKQEHIHFKIENCKGRLQVSQEKLSQLQEQHHNQKENLAKIISQFTEVSQPFSELLQILQQRVQEYEQLTQLAEYKKQRVQDLENELNVLKATLQEKQNNLQNLRQEIEKIEEQIRSLKEERHQKWPSDTPNEDRKAILEKEKKYQEQIQELKQKITKLQTENEQKKSYIYELKEKNIKLNGEISKRKQNVEKILLQTQFYNLQALEAALLTEAQVKEYEKTIRKYTDELNATQKLRDQAKKEYQNKLFQAQEQGLISEIDKLNQTLLLLDTEYQKTENLLSQLQEQSGEIHEKIKLYKNFTNKIDELKNEHQKIRPRYEAWLELCHSIGERQGLKFEKFVQQITLDYLCKRANFYLENLNPRYKIQKDPNETKELEIEVVDSYQANTTRLPSSLSGGETFLLSLALSLALSDLGGSKMQIQTLFIDEGFGTLDPETLDTAIRTLENLQSGGKLIGLITHVEEMKQRIHVQINVVPLGNGISEVNFKF